MENIPESGSATVSEDRKFNLPWLGKWREDFLETSRILSRERHADEIAQRLIYRLRLRFDNSEEKFSDIKVLACVTTPAMLLAAALHRWWPIEPRPAIADLGYYLMLGNFRELPIIVSAGKVLVVQDVLDTQKISGDLVSALNNRNIEVAGVVGFVRLVPDPIATRATAVNYWWTPKIGDPPHHALVETRRPNECEPPKNSDEDARAFWVEPRSLHPFRYQTLRRDFSLGRDPYLDRRDRALQHFDSATEGFLLSAGHYVYGRRHYAVTVDLRQALIGTVGDRIARWLADICEGRKDRKKEEWETESSQTLTGDVTAVLMPLHSQIHYVWPKVENLLAQRGRRQPNWWLEATLFTGAGPHYLLPAQFENQIAEAVREAIHSSRRDLIERPLRILIVDDSIATAQTAENVLSTILREVRKVFNQISAELKSPKKWTQCPSPIEWIRYFAVLNQMDNNRRYLWNHIPAIGRKPIPLTFEEFAPFMGVPVYDEQNCPACLSMQRLKELKTKCEQRRAEEALQWTQTQLAELQPIAVDSPDFQSRGKKDATITPIEVLTFRSRPAVSLEKFRFRHADTAIWRFYELMYLSYPPNDVLQSLDKAWPRKKADPHEEREYERYRWAVLSWCLNNWARIRANVSESLFIACARREVQRNTILVEQILEAMSVNYRDPSIGDFVSRLITRLAELEGRRAGDRSDKPGQQERIAKLDKSLTLFFLGIPREFLGQFALMSHLDRVSRGLGPGVHSLLRNLYLNVTRPQRYAEPRWALETIAESLYRGRDANNPAYGSHELLPKLILDVRTQFTENADKRRLLRGSVNNFLGALEDIKHYSGWEFSSMITKLELMCTQVLDWLKLRPDNEEYADLPDELRHLEDAIRLEGEFCNAFDEVFHANVKSLGIQLEAVHREKGYDRLCFRYVADELVQSCFVLTNVHGLKVCLANRAIDPIMERLDTKHNSRIEVHLDGNNSGTRRLVFRLLTNFASLDETIRLTNSGLSGNAEQTTLETYGTKFGSWQAPSTSETDEGFTAAYEISVLTGLMPRLLQK